MRIDALRLNVDQTVGEALLAIRENPPESRIIYFYVINGESHLKGVVATRRLLLNAPEILIKEIMVGNVLTISDTATVLEACEYFIFHRLLAFPIVDTEFCLLGVVDVELYTNELSDIDRRLDAVKQTSSIVAFNNRFPQLIANIAGGLMAAFLSGVFEAELQMAVALASTDMATLLIYVTLARVLIV